MVLEVICYLKGSKTAQNSVRQQQIQQLSVEEKQKESPNEAVSTIASWKNWLNRKTQLVCD